MDTMALTGAAIIGFLVFALLALFVGQWLEKIEIYVLGCLVLIFMGLLIVNTGIREVGGQTTVGTMATATDPNTNTTTTYQYVENKDEISSGLGAIFMAIGAGAGLTFYYGRKRREEERMNDPDQLP